MFKDMSHFKRSLTSLRCNGNSDCDDNSDEDGCDSLNERDDKCSTLMPIPGAERGTQGYNILTGDFVSHVLDPKYFGGECEYVYNGEWRKYIYEAFCESLQYNDEEKNYRKPYNYHTYQFVAQAQSEGSHEYYEDMASMLNARKTMSSSSGGFTVGVYHVEAGISASEESEFFTNLTQYKSQDLGFIRLSSKVQTARFKLRSNNLMLHEDFYMSLMELPELYNFGMYSKFLNTFGTHYVTEGTMGGTLEYIAVVNKTAMAESRVESEKIGGCIGGSIGLSVPIKTTGSESSSSMIMDKLILVKGGVTGTSSTALLTDADLNTHRKWGASLQYNPALIEHEIMPIYELIRFSTASDHVGVRIANLERAVDEYMQQFDSCRCAPCQHNGIPVLSGTSCSCICKSGYWGEACEETFRPGAKTDGSWSCWAAWSTCTSGLKRRTRVCNNPPPEGGGSTCVGSSSQTRRC
uniref:MACPF domain-containing protein n=1 Tax=Gouania willdenowi TaxID=441366 RepID=A0A8C5NA67_GOUWI